MNLSTMVTRLVLYAIQLCLIYCVLTGSWLKLTIAILKVVQFSIDCKLELDMCTNQDNI